MMSVSRPPVVIRRQKIGPEKAIMDPAFVSYAHITPYRTNINSVMVHASLSPRSSSSCSSRPKSSMPCSLPVAQVHPPPSVLQHNSIKILQGKILKKILKSNNKNQS